jgi:oligopeptide/dipeptide ABC transporter ATP-binding protein
MSNEATLTVDRLSVQFDARGGASQVLDEVSLSVAPGHTLGIVGESGSGKSVLARTILGLTQEAPNARVSGSIRLRAQELAQATPAQWRQVRGREIAMVFQDPMTSLNPVLTVGTQIVQVLREHRPLTRAQAMAQAADLLAQVGIPDPVARLAEYPHRLSGGMRQRVVIAIALACGPRLLIADEPTTALDVTVQAQVITLLRELQERLGMAMIFITHNLGLVREVCHDVAVMYAGQIVERGPVAQVISSPRMPYTRKLLQSVPRMDGPIHARLAAIPGAPPKLDQLPPGCRFRPRCDQAFDRCGQMPPWVADAAAGGHRCWLAEQGAP